MCIAFPDGGFNQELINDQSLSRLTSSVINWKIENTSGQFSYKQTDYEVK